MALIESKQNPKVKLARALYDRKTRDEQKLYLVEGTFHVGIALETGAPIEFVLYAPGLLRGEFAKALIATLSEKQVQAHEVDSAILEGLASKENPQGMLAVVRQHPTPLSELRLVAAGLAIAAVTPQDPGNVGSILRTIDAAGAAALILLDGGVDAWHPQAVRAGMGAHFTKPIATATFAEFESWAKGHGYPIYGSSAKAERDYREAHYALPGVLLLGSEREGLTAAQQAACTQVVRLPMRGRVTSLNLAVAAGVLVYEMLKEESAC
jgi:TrmH family RNA methyltransferase